MMHFFYIYDDRFRLVIDTSKIVEGHRFETGVNGEHESSTSPFSYIPSIQNHVNQ